MITYVLTSHSDAFIPLILRGIADNLPEVTEVRLVQDEDRPITDGAHWGLADILVPPMEPPHFAFGRLRQVLDFTLREHVAVQQERYALVMHCDLVPIAPMCVADILDGRAIAGRGAKGRLFCPYTWILIDREKWHGEWSIQTPQETAVYLAYRLEGQQTPLPLDQAGYEYDLGFEWCAPGFLHADKVRMIQADPVLFARKVAAMRRIVDALQITSGELPGILEMLHGYYLEKRVWVAMGRPVRTADRIREIHGICSQCPLSIKIDVHRLRCKPCGCFITDAEAWPSKNTWATTSCPLKQPRWLPEPGARSMDTGCEGCGQRAQKIALASGTAPSLSQGNGGSPPC